MIDRTIRTVVLRQIQEFYSDLAKDIHPDDPNKPQQPITVKNTTGTRVSIYLKNACVCEFTVVNSKVVIYDTVYGWSSEIDLSDPDYLLQTIKEMNVRMCIMFQRELRKRGVLPAQT